MKVGLGFKLTREKIPIDYYKYIVSFLKHCLEENKREYFEKYFGKNSLKKDYTWSIYLGKCKFLPKEKMIEIENKKIGLNFSTSSPATGILFFNSFMGQLRKTYPFGAHNEIVLEDIQLLNEKEIDEEETCFKILSPIVVKERIEGENRDKYFTFLDEEWKEVLKRNMKFQMKDVFEFDPSYDIEALEITAQEPYTKKTVVTCYGISFPVTIGEICLKGEKYLLDYLYKTGLGSKQSSGFGYIEKM